MTWLVPGLTLAAGLVIGAAVVALVRRRRAETVAADPQSLSDFLADLSHELRTPLTLVLGALDNALGDRGTGVEPLLRRDLRVARANALRQLRLLEQFLSLSKLEAGRLELRLSRLDLATLLGRQVAAFRSLAERRGVSLVLETDPQAMDQADRPLWADSERLQQVFANLLSNALRFTPEGGSITVRVRQPGAEEGTRPASVLVEVEDTGPGIPPEALPHLFDRFFQAGRRRAAGAGIGLALARELVRLHGGELSADSAPGRGSTFTVRLRLGWDHFEDAGWEVTDGVSAELSTETEIEVAVSEQDRGETHAADDERPLLLLVDDERELRQQLRAALGDGYCYHEAGDGAEALEALEAIDPDLVISDVAMPSVDGFELCRRIRESPELDHLPVVLLTALADTEDRLTGLAHGADDYLPRPLGRRELRARVANLVERRRRLREHYRRGSIFALPELEATPIEERFLDRLAEALEERLGDAGLDVPALAAALAMSPRTLQRKARALTGESPHSLIQAARLERARQLLEQRAGNVSEICYRVGFQDPSHFSRAFSARFGRPPSDVLQGQGRASRHDPPPRGSGQFQRNRTPNR